MFTAFCILVLSASSIYQSLNYGRLTRRVDELERRRY